MWMFGVDGKGRTIKVECPFTWSEKDDVEFMAAVAKLGKKMIARPNAQAVHQVAKSRVGLR